MCGTHIGPGSASMLQPQKGRSSDGAAMLRPGLLARECAAAAGVGADADGGGGCWEVTGCVGEQEDMLVLRCWLQ